MDTADVSMAVLESVTKSATRSFSPTFGPRVLGDGHVVADELREGADLLRNDTKTVGFGVMREPRAAFQQELQNIDIHVMQLFVFVAEDLGVATDALLTNNADGFKLVSEREMLIDSLYREVENLLNRELILEAPVAADFRLLISMVRIVPELERSHDLVVDIAESATHILGEELSPRSKGLVQRMGETAGGMWNDAAAAWQQRDPEAVEALEERDDDLDGLHSALLAELASGKMSLPVAMDMTLVARYFERLGAHAVNIVRRVGYVAGSPPN